MSGRMVQSFIPQSMNAFNWDFSLWSHCTRGPTLTQQTAAIVVTVAPYSLFISQRVEIIGSAGCAV